jgi:toxin-antitoxin system PIN domain toxin
VQLVDTNVLVYAVNRSAKQHRAAHGWLVGALDGNESIGFAWTALLGFLRLTTNPRVFATPLQLVDATALVEFWLGQRPSTIVEPTARHVPILRSLLAGAGTGANLVNDAHLAALALEHDATIVSFDRDFQRFEGVRSRLPANG